MGLRLDNYLNLKLLLDRSRFPTLIITQSYYNILYVWLRIIAVVWFIKFFDERNNLYHIKQGLFMKFRDLVEVLAYLDTTLPRIAISILFSLFYVTSFY